MFRRLVSLTLALSLAATAFTSTADARGFARPPGGAPADRLVENLRAPVDRQPVINAAARARLRKVLAARRAKNVAAFRAYARRGVYPHNYVTSGELNVWIDGDGHMCAAATMIFRSGAKQLVRQVAKEHNWIRLGDVTEGPLMDWMLTSGLTQAEIAAIQVPMVGGPSELPRQLEPDPKDWRLAEDARLKARYAEVLTMLARDRDAGLEAAIDALATRPDLIAKLI